MSRAKILLVDDDQDIRFAIRECMDAAGFQVVEAAEYDAALALMDSSIDLAVVDIVLTGKSGLEILAHIQDRHPEMPVIIISGHSSKENAIEALHKGASGYLEKPINIDKLLHVIKRSLA